jgi:hypothetical protein
MAKGIKTAGSGRKKGTKNKHKAVSEIMRDVVVQSVTKGELPLEFMLRLMRDENESKTVRCEMAKAAAPYVHAKVITEIKHSGTLNLDSMSIDEIKSEIFSEIDELGILPSSLALPKGIANQGPRNGMKH